MENQKEQEFEDTDSENSQEDDEDEEDYSDAICRICYEDTTPLYSICDCSGSIKYVHSHCALKWITQKISETKEVEIPDCEICHQQFFVTLQKGEYRTQYSFSFENLKKSIFQETVSLSLHFLLFLSSFLILTSLLCSIISLSLFDKHTYGVCEEIGVYTMSQLFAWKTCKGYFISRNGIIKRETYREVYIRIMDDVEELQ